MDKSISGSSWTSSAATKGGSSSPKQIHDVREKNRATYTHRMATNEARNRTLDRHWQRGQFLCRFIALISDVFLCPGVVIFRIVRVGTRLNPALSESSDSSAIGLGFDLELPIRVVFTLVD